MKITRLETIYVLPRWLFLKVHTDEGLIGLGEPVVERRSQTVAAAVHEMGRYLIGQDPLRVIHNWQAIYRQEFYQGGTVLTSALSGIEQALWDIKGKYYNAPVYELLGGSVRDKIQVYGHFGGGTREEYTNSANNSKKSVFSMFKMTISAPILFIDTLDIVDQVVEIVSSAREALGRDTGIGIDFHGRAGPAMAKILLKAIEPYQPMFVEEPVLPGNISEMTAVARSTCIPIVTDEQLFTKWQFREVLEKGAATNLHPDISNADGIFEGRLITGMAEAYYGAIAPYCPLGPIALASCIQQDACTPNFLNQDTVTLGEGYLKEPFKLNRGNVQLPKKPGLGIELDDLAVEQKLFDGCWDGPHHWHEDGSVADW